jgi:hypothetical protein
MENQAGKDARAGPGARKTAAEETLAGGQNADFGDDEKALGRTQATRQGCLGLLLQNQNKFWFWSSRVRRLAIITCEVAGLDRGQKHPVNSPQATKLT